MSRHCHGNSIQAEGTASAQALMWEGVWYVQGRDGRPCGWGRASLGQAGGEVEGRQKLNHVHLSAIVRRGTLFYEPNIHATKVSKTRCITGLSCLSPPLHPHSICLGSRPCIMCVGPNFLLPVSPPHIQPLLPSW